MDEILAQKTKTKTKPKPKTLDKNERNPGQVAQLVKHLAHGFGSGHDPGFQPHVGLCAIIMEPGLDSVSLHLSAPSSILSLSKKKKKKKKKKQKTTEI